MARPGHTVYKMFRAVEDEQREKTQCIEIGTAFLRADGKSIGLEFNDPPATSWPSARTRRIRPATPQPRWVRQAGRPSGPPRSPPSASPLCRSGSRPRFACHSPFFLKVDLPISDKSSRSIGLLRLPEHRRRHRQRIDRLDGPRLWRQLRHGRGQLTLPWRCGSRLAPSCAFR